MRPSASRVARKFLEAGRYNALGNEFIDKLTPGQPDGTELIRALDALGDAIRTRDWDTDYPQLNEAQREEMKQHYGRAATLMLQSGQELSKSIRNVRKRVDRRSE